MGTYPSKQDEIVKAENFNQESLADSSFSILNIHGASSLGGALLVIVVILLAVGGYGVAKYLRYLRKCRSRAITSLGLKPTVEP